MLNQIINALSSVPFLLLAEAGSLLIKSYIIVKLFMHRTEKQTQFKKAWILLILILLGSILEDFSWIIKLSHQYILPYQSIIPNIDYRFVVLSLRIAWAFAIVQYQSLSLLIENLIPTKSKTLSIINQIFIVISSIYCSVFLYLIVFKTYYLERPKIEFSTLTQVSIYIPIITLTSLIFAFIRIRQVKIPKILKKQLNIFMIGLIGPRIISDTIQLYPFNIIPNYVTSNYAVIGISSLMIAYTAYFCINRMMRLRFLNMKKHVVTSDSDDFFMGKFKHFLEQLSKATTIPELNHIVKTYFKEVLNIADGKTNLYIRNNNNNNNTANFFALTNDQNIKESIVESFITTNKMGIDYLHDTPTLVLDEIEFNYFYQDNQLNSDLLNFLNQIESEMFIPIYQNKILIAYITVEKDPYSKRLYSNVERDEISVFVKYLGNIINLMQKRNLDTLIEQEKDLKEELYQKHQQINQYKESIKSFIKNNHKKIGIIFYKSRKFIYGNQDAKEIINFNVNSQPGHPLTKKLDSIAKQVETYKSPQNCFAKDSHDNTIILTAIPNLDQNNVIITIHYPDITDIIKKQIDLLADPTQWDYLLYLETTKSGQLINKLIPGSGELMLSFKIELLKIALSKKAILISMPDDDLTPTVDLIHHISLRENLYTLKLHSPATNFNTPMQLFGINPIFGKTIEQPLLQKLNQNGTLFIQNIHYLGLEAQNYLAEFIRYGFYRVFRSEQKQFSDVRIICSTNQNLQTLIQEGKFSPTLYKELQKTSLVMPSLLTLPKYEIYKLIEAITNETLGNGSFKDLLELNDKEKQTLINKCPSSIREFKTKIQSLLNEKSKKNHIHVDTQFDSASDISDPKLSEAVKLGKYALKDPKIMSWMWNKFKNQNKIASLLGVNRSSVHRRCKEYNLY
jgi:transcriptional regulator with PAS, ATPase and Fis domain